MSKPTATDWTIYDMAAGRVLAAGTVSQEPKMSEWQPIETARDGFGFKRRPLPEIIAEIEKDAEALFGKEPQLDPHPLLKQFVELFSWQPIETAPMDGTEVDLWVVASHSGEQFRFPAVFWEKDANDWRPRWNGNLLSRFGYKPLMWRLPPKPPQETE